MQSRKDFTELARRLNESGKELAKQDIKLAYHNHSFEFEKYGDATGFELIYDLSDPQYVEAQIDTAWMQKGGADVVSWIKDTSQVLNP